MTSDSTSNNARTSFFDEDDLNIDFSFQKPGNKQIKDMALPPVLNNILLRPSSTDGLFQQGYYILHSKTMAYYKHTLATQAEAVLDLTHCRMVPLQPTNTVAYFGFSLSRNGNKFDFYSPDEKTIEAWITQLKTICVLTNFHEEYKALKMIGKGSFAKVYLVESKTNTKNFAVKAFTKESVIASNKNNAKACMWNEIEIMRALDHDKVIKLHEVYETDKSIYLVLELIQGRSLQEILKKESFKDNEPRIINVISSLLEALAYLAAKGVMHRDLKPDNILVDKLDNIKIVDFGLATFIEVPEYIFKKCGTPGYIAPEVFKYDPKNASTNYDGKCDVFSAGCILYFMLFGKSFFEGANASEILKTNRRFTNEYENLNRVKKELKEPTLKVNRDVFDLCIQLLEIDQKYRFTAAHSLTHRYIAAVVNQKQQGVYDFYQNGGSSPLFVNKPGSFASPGLQIPSKDGHQTLTPIRFTEKDSLYLDVGRPELTGRIDTLTNGSSNSSMLLASRVTSHADQSPCLSPFGKAANRSSIMGEHSASLSPFAKGQGQTPRSFKTYVSGLQPGMIKTGGYRSEVEGHEYSQSGLLRSRLEEVPLDNRRYSEVQSAKVSEFSSTISSPEYVHYNKLEDDSAYQAAMERVKLGNQAKSPLDLGVKRTAPMGVPTYTISSNVPHGTTQQYRYYEKGN